MTTNDLLKKHAARILATGLRLVDFEMIQDLDEKMLISELEAIEREQAAAVQIKQKSVASITRRPRAGSLSNAIITRRNGGVRHMFIDDIGGCSANYR